MIKAGPEKVWALVSNHTAIQQWHPAVAEAILRRGADKEGNEALYRAIKFTDGTRLVEKLNEVQEAGMKLDAWMEEGDLPVSNFRSILQVKAGPNPQESLVTWTGRFGNKANTLDAPPGQDNVTAIAAVGRFFDAGLAGLKQRMEKN